MKEKIIYVIYLYHILHIAMKHIQIKKIPRV